MPSRPSAFAVYLTGLGSWFIPLGIQQVLFSWLAAIVLHMDAFAVGIAQVALMAPGILFLPLGGLVADRGNPRRLLLIYHFLYSVPPMVLGGVLAMFGAIAVLFVLPWLDTSRVRSATFRPIYKWFMLLLVVDVVVLGFCGANPPQGFWIPLSQLATVYYFFHFLVLLPILGKIERPLPLPPSIADAVLKKAS